jgi:hypothetical protein
VGCSANVNTKLPAAIVSGFSVSGFSDGQLNSAPLSSKTGIELTSATSSCTREGLEMIAELGPTLRFAGKVLVIVIT